MTKDYPNTKQRPRCPACKKAFLPDPRVGSRQKYCSRKECQFQRQRLNEKAWTKNPENQRFLKAKQRRWRKSHPEYWRQWRQKHPDYVRRNRMFMQEYQRRKRDGKLFAKTKEMASQVIKNKGVVYTSRGNTWILMRLKRPGRWTKALRVRYASKRIRCGPVRLPQGQLYKL